MTQDDTTGGTAREMLRHALATLAYRGGKAVRGSTDHFADFKTEATIRTPGQVLAHIGDLLDWALSLADGRHAWHDSAPRPWPEEVARFFEALARLDARLASEAPLGFTPERDLPGPDRRRPHPRGPAHDAPPDVRRAGARRELPEGRHRGRPRGAGAVSPRARVRLSSLAPAGLRAGRRPAGDRTPLRRDAGRGRADHDRRAVGHRGASRPAGRTGPGTSQAASASRSSGRWTATTVAPERQRAMLPREGLRGRGLVVRPDEGQGQERDERAATAAPAAQARRPRSDARPDGHQDGHERQAGEEARGLQRHDAARRERQGGAERERDDGARDEKPRGLAPEGAPRPRP